MRERWVKVNLRGFEVIRRDERRKLKAEILHVNSSVLFCRLSIWFQRRAVHLGHRNLPPTIHTKIERERESKSRRERTRE